MKVRSDFFILVLGTVLSCNCQLYAQNCAGMPAFVEDLDFDRRRTALSTSETDIKGLVLIEFGEKGQVVRRHQDPSWDDEGYLSAIARDRSGHAYVAPKPNVNMLHTNVDHLNTVFRVNAKTAQLEPFTHLPRDVSDISDHNPFGILGLHYDCNTDMLWVSSISGSDVNEEKGGIYVIDVGSKKARLVVNGIDALGLAIRRIGPQQFELLYGSARNSFVYSIQLNKELKPVSRPQAIVSMEGLGPRGDDRARKLVLQGNELMVYGTSFYYNLSPPSKRGDAKYYYRYMKNTMKWEFVGLRE